MLQSILILLVLVCIALYIDLVQRFLPKRRAQLFIWLAFAVYILGNLYFTLLSRVIGSGRYVDLRPFGTYLRLSESIDVGFQNATGFAAFFLQGTSFFTSVVLNIFLYYPLGFFLAALFPDMKGWKIILLSFAASVVTELTQYILRMGWVELDDVIHNTLGTVLGLYARIWYDKHFTIRKCSQ